MIDFAQAIRSTRQIVKQSQAMYGPESWLEHRIKKPLLAYLFLQREFDVQFRDQRKLLERGEVVWGAIVQANILLMQPDRQHSMLPAAILYTLDPGCDAEPGFLRANAQRLFDLKGEQCAPEVQAFADKLADERVVDVKLPVPKSFTGGVSCFYAIVMIARSQLPRGFLESQLFPILVNPKETNATMVVPHAYWDADFKRQWGML